MTQPIVERYLELTDAAIPDCIEGLYLVGSLALNDFHPGRSDVDFVAVTGSPLVASELSTLDQAHTQLSREHPRPYFDGIYVTWDDLRRNPIGLVPPFTHESRFHPSGGFESNPSVWLTLHRYPLAVRGREAPEVWHDDAAIRQWNIENLNTYWRNAVDQRRRPEARIVLHASEKAMRETVTWCVTGVSRLHYTIATGDVTSKTGACRYALDAFPARWHPIITEALALRLGQEPPRRSRRERLEEVLAFMDFVIQDAS